MALSILIVLFFIAIAVQLAYFISFLAAFSRYVPRQADAVEGTLPPVSVIVCAHNEEANLRELIPQLLEQSYPVFEVIIVNDRSDDDTHWFLQELAAAHPQLRFVTVNETPARMNSKKYALTLGIRAARHPIILLTDADCRPASAQWIRAMASSFDDATQLVIGYSPYYPAAGFLNAFIRFETLLTGVQYMGMALLGMPYMGVGRNLAYRKSLFMDNKGFHDYMDLTGGDDDLFVNRHARAGNTRICVGTETLVYSLPKKSWRAYFQQKLRHLSAGKHYKMSHRWLLGLFHVSYILSWALGITLVALQVDFYYSIIVILVMRSVVILLTTWRVTGRLGDKGTSWLTLFLDFIYVFYYISTGLRALFTKKVKWTI